MQSRSMLSVDCAPQWLALGLIVVVAFCAIDVPAEETKAGHTDPSGQNQEKRPLSVSDFVEMTQIVDPSVLPGETAPKFSPDGRKFLAVTKRGRLGTGLNEYSLLVFKVSRLPTAKNSPDVVASFSSSSNRDAITAARWLSNETITFIGENRSEPPQVYAVDCRTRLERRLTKDSSGVREYAVTHDLSRIIYTVPAVPNAVEVKYKNEHGFTVAEEGLPDLASGNWQRPESVFTTSVKDLKSGKFVQVRGGPFRSFDFRLALWISPDGKYAITERPAFPVPEIWGQYEDPWLKRMASNVRQLARSKLQSPWLTQTMLIDTERGNIQPLIDAPLGARSLPKVLWASDSRSAIVAATYLPLAMADERELARRKALPAIVGISIPNREFVRIADLPEGHFRSLEGSANLETIVVYSVGGDRQSQLQAVYRHQGPGWVQQSRPPTSAARPTVAVSQGLDRSPELVVIDRSTHREVAISDFNPQFRQRTFGRIEVIHWTGKQGEPWTGGLVYPTDYKPDARYPLVIQTHGFDPHRFLLDGPSDIHTAFAAQAFAGKGILVLQLGFGPGFGETQATPQEGPAQVSGYESAIDYLDEKGLIDRDRVGIIGFSRSGYHAKYALTHSRFHFVAATIAEGPDYGLVMYVTAITDPITTGEYRSIYGGPPWPANWKPWMELSATFNADKISTPLRLEAHRTPGAILFEWEMYGSLRDLGKPVELVYIPNGAHDLMKPWERITSQQGNVDWFCFWLKGEEDPDPAKAEQYARWRELRKLQQQNEKNSPAPSPN